MARLLAGLLVLGAVIPACDQAQLELLATGTLIRCRPPQAALDQLTEALADDFTTVADRLPAVADLATLAVEPSPPGGAKPATTDLASPLQQVQAARQILPMLVAVAFAFLLLATLLASRSWRSLLLTWGTPLLLAGLATGLLALALGPLISAGLSQLRSGMVVGGLTPGMASLIGAVVAALFERVWSLQLITDGVLAALGAGLLAARRRFAPG